MTTKQENLSVKCPDCLARPGEPCLGLDTGRKLKQVHTKRAGVIRQEKRTKRINVGPTAPGVFAGCAFCGIDHLFGECGNK